MLALVLPALTLFVLLFLPYYWLRLSRSSRLTAHLPGPKPLPFIGNALDFGSNTVDIMSNVRRLVRDHGLVFRFWLGKSFFIFLADAKYAENILSSSSNISKNMTYKFLEPWLGTGLLTSTGNKWKHHRKIITPAFHFKILEEFVDVFNTNGNILIQQLKEHADGEEFDIYNYITVCALDIISESAMGVPMNLQNKHNSEYVSAVQGLADIIMKRTFSPWLFPDFIFNMTGLGRLQRKYVKVLHDTTNKVITTRKREFLAKKKEDASQNEVGQKRRLAFLDLLLQYNKDGANLTDEEIREEVDTFMFEGHDTTASGISFCLWLLANHPHVQDKVHQELLDVFGDTDREPEAADLQDMKYLECVIKESQRLYPSVPFFARRLDEEIRLDGLHLIPGTNVLVSPFIMNRNPKYFPDPEKFDPDRFLLENSRGRHPYAYVPFSAGPRNCIGQRFAMMEMKSTVGKVIRHFKITPGSRDIILSTELVLRNWGGLYVKLENRK